MAEGDIGGIIDSLEFDGVNCLDPAIINVGGDIYAIAYRGPDNDGWLKTVEIAPNGAITDAVIDSLEFDGVFCNVPKLIKIADNVIAIAFEGETNHGWLKTIQINALGGITDAVIDSLRFDGYYCNEPAITKVGDHIYAITYQAGSPNPRIKTIEIAPNGVITDAVIDDRQYDTQGGYYPDIVNVTTGMWAIAYQGELLDGYIVTITILPNGEIGATVTDKYEFDPVRCDFPKLIHISGDIYAIAYNSEGTTGRLKTVEIAPNGAITDAVIDSLEFDVVSGGKPDIIRISGNVYVIGCIGTSNDGWLKTVEIAPTGAITDAVIDSLQYDATHGFHPNIIFLSGNIYAIAYQGPNDDGWLKTVEINTIIGGQINHLLLMGIGQ